MHDCGTCTYVESCVRVRCCATNFLTSEGWQGQAGSFANNCFWCASSFHFLHTLVPVSSYRPAAAVTTAALQQQCRPANEKQARTSMWSGPQINFCGSNARPLFLHPVLIHRRVLNIDVFTSWFKLKYGNSLPRECRQQHVQQQSIRTRMAHGNFIRVLTAVNSRRG